MKTDSIFLQQAKANPQYQYWTEINEASKGASDSGFVDFDGPSRSFFESDFFTVSMFIVVGATILLIIWRIAKGLNFTIDRDDDSPQGLGDDTIYGHKWATEISDRMAQAEYSEVVVLCYLMWLDKLNDARVIKFSQSKTPGMFQAELANYCTQHSSTVAIDGTEWTADRLIAKTRTLTDNYLRIRYGHKPSSAQLAKQMMEL